MKKINALLSSIILHSIILLLFCMKLTSSQIIPEGKAAPRTILSYLYHEHPINKSITPLKKLTTAIKKLKQIALHQTHAITQHVTQSMTQHITQHQQKTALISHAAAGNNIPLSTLVEMLHNAIEQKQHYPESALQLEREGKTTVMFTLFPDGSIKNLHIVTASGTESLDEAALQAVNDAVPFKNVGKYLSTSAEYQVKISFELT